MTPEGIVRLAAKALAAGGRMVTPTRVEWELQGNCLMPVGRDISYRAGKKSLGLTGGHSITPTSVQRLEPRVFNKNPLPVGLVVGLTLRCRMCDKCRAGRRLHWSRAAIQETGYSFRTWFGTVTLSPEKQMHYLRLARQKYERQGGDFDLLPYGEQFRLKCLAISRAITLYLKRIRRCSGAPIRYLWVTEAHKSGDPHFHVLVHESSPDHQVLYRILSDQWKLGFTKWKLVRDLSGAAYLCKYLSKSTAARVRASVRYGKDDLSIIDTRRLGYREQNDLQKTFFSGSAGLGLPKGFIETGQKEDA